MSAETLAQSVRDPMTPQVYRVARAQRELADTVTLSLTPEDGGAVMEFAPGQFNMLYVFGVGEIAISISGDPLNRSRLTHTVRAVGTVSRAIRELAASDTIGVRGPFGAGWPLERAEGRDVIVVAGGIGLAPLRPAMYRLMAERERYGRVALLYGARTPRDILFRRELERWRSRLDLDVLLTVDRADPSWHGSVGVVTRLIPRAPFDPANAVAFLVGPEIMMRLTAMELIKTGLAADSVYLSMERNMKCAVGLCGHCQFGPYFICKDGPVFSYPQVQRLLLQQEF